MIITSHKMSIHQSHGSSHYVASHQEPSISCSSNLNTRNVSYRRNSKTYHSIKDFFKSLAKKKASPKKIAEAINFIFNGENFHVVESPKKFEESRNCYCKQFIEAPWECPEISFMDYDVSKITKPQIVKKQIIFYVESNYIPFKITSPWPINTNKPHIKQEMLSSIK
ncbi:MAG: hypothetical protein VX777_10550 [Chlamydiota bacterium]|nr:hypothetical protein [Chlamydiota bacterium]